jgi:hypothetical protein
MLSVSLSPVITREVLNDKKGEASQGALTKLADGNTPGAVHLPVPAVICVLLTLSPVPAKEYCVIAFPETPAGRVAVPLSEALATA